VGKRKTTVYVDQELLRAARVFAARAGKRDSEVIEDALRAHLGIEALERIWSRSDLSEDEALSLAYEAVHQSRAAGPGRIPDLTDREMQILALVAFGMDEDQIAQQLHVPASEVGAAVTSAFDKLKRSQDLRGPNQQLPQRSDR
jgi:DNA-binding NarL/FixJ family response regulator